MSDHYELIHVRSYQFGPESKTGTLLNEISAYVRALEFHRNVHVLGINFNAVNDDEDGTIQYYATVHVEEF